MWITVPEVRKTTAAYDSQDEYIMYSTTIIVKRNDPVYLDPTRRRPWGLLTGDFISVARRLRREVKASLAKAVDEVLHEQSKGSKVFMK